MTPSPSASPIPPAPQRILEHLTRDELVAAVDALELQARDRRSKDAQIEVLAAQGAAVLSDVLGSLARDRLKAVCRALDLDDGGREKSVLVARLVGAVVPEVTESSEPPSDATEGEAEAAPKKRGGRVAKAKGGAAGGGDLGFEAKLWQAADKLRSNMDAGAYKHVVLGLVFLKYISDAFEARHAQLVAEAGQGSDPEDRDEYLAERVFWVPKAARWPAIQARAKDPRIGQLIDEAMPMFQRQSANERESTTLAQLRDLLLPKLLSGALRIRDAERAVEAAL